MIHSNCRIASRGIIDDAAERTVTLTMLPADVPVAFVVLNRRIGIPTDYDAESLLHDIKDAGFDNESSASIFSEVTSTMSWADGGLTFHRLARLSESYSGTWVIAEYVPGFVYIERRAGAERSVADLIWLPL